MHVCKVYTYVCVYVCMHACMYVWYVYICLLKRYPEKNFKYKCNSLHSGGDSIFETVFFFLCAEPGAGS